MSSFNVPLSPIINDNEDDHTDEDKTEPYEVLNTSAAIAIVAMIVTLVKYLLPLLLRQAYYKRGYIILYPSTV